MHMSNSVSTGELLELGTDKGRAVVGHHDFWKTQCCKDLPHGGYGRD